MLEDWVFVELLVLSDFVVESVVLDEFEEPDELDCFDVLSVFVLDFVSDVVFDVELLVLFVFSSVSRFFASFRISSACSRASESDSTIMPSFSCSRHDCGNW